MPLKNGYSRDTVLHNIAQMMNDKTPHANAVAAAFSSARASFFKSYPGGALPAWLAFPAGYRIRQYYNANGTPKYSKTAETKTNPSMRENLKSAARRFTGFTGNLDVSVRKIKTSSPDKIVLAIGPADGLLYSTVRDGVAEKYIHRFAKKSRPLLAASPDGKRLYLIGGSFTFTNRGIVDAK